MNASQLWPAALWSRRAAAAAVFLVGVRFAWVAGDWASESYEASKNPDAEVTRRPRTPVVATTEEESARGAADSARSGRDSGAVSPTQRGAGRRPDDKRSTDAKPEVRMLFVDLGPPRSEVYVSGVRLGQTPYAGTWSCRPGDVVTIHVVPPKAGEPLESRAACQDSMRAVSGRTLTPDDVAELLADPAIPPSVKDALRR